MAKIIVFAALEPIAGREDELHEAIRVLVTASEEEAGLEVYAAHTADDGAVWFYEVYDSQEAWDVHGRGERMRAARQDSRGSQRQRRRCTWSDHLPQGA